MKGRNPLKNLQHKMPRVNSPTAAFPKLVPSDTRKFSRNCTASSLYLNPPADQAPRTKKDCHYTSQYSATAERAAPAPGQLGPSTQPHSQAGTQLEARAAGRQPSSQAGRGRRMRPAAAATRSAARAVHTCDALRLLPYGRELGRQPLRRTGGHWLPAVVRRRRASVG